MALLIFLQCALVLMIGVGSGHGKVCETVKHIEVPQGFSDDVVYSFAGFTVTNSGTKQREIETRVYKSTSDTTGVVCASGVLTDEITSFECSPDEVQGVVMRVTAKGGGPIQICYLEVKGYPVPEKEEAETKQPEQEEEREVEETKQPEVIMTRELHNCRYPGFGHSGNDIGGGVATTVQGCADSCRRDGNCRGSTWDDKKNCYKHHTIALSNIGENFQGGKAELFLKDCIDRLFGCAYRSYGHSGNDIGGGFASTEEGCIYACRSDVKCAGSTYDSHRNCYKHHTIERQRISGNFQGGNSNLFVKDCIEEFSGCKYPTFGHSGNDIGGGFRTSREGCSDACRSDNKCAGSTWDSHQNCYKHHTIERARVSGNFQNGNSELFVKSCLDELIGCQYRGIVHSGNDIGGGFPSSSEGCMRECRKDGKCVGSSYVNYNCWKHHTIQREKIGAIQGTNQVLFLKSCINELRGCRYPRYGHQGNDITTGFPTTIKGCAEACRANTKCLGSTWDMNRNCFLHHSIERSRIIEKYQGGRTELFLKTCYDKLSGCKYPTYGYPGHDIGGGFPSSPEVCAYACRKDRKCAGSTWDVNSRCWKHHTIDKGRITKNYQGGRGELFLKNCNLV